MWKWQRWNCNGICDFTIGYYDRSVGVLHEPYIEPDSDAKSYTYGENKSALTVISM